MVQVLFLSLVPLLVAGGSASAEGQNISAVIGGEVTLPCRAEGYMPLELMEWSRPGTHLQYVVIFRTQSQDLEIPEQRYEGRVELKDRENGDVSLVLKNVTAEDGGTYQCYVLKKGRRKRAIQPVSTVYLDVLPPPALEDMDSRREEGKKRDGGNKVEEETRGNHGGSVTAIVAVVAACVVMAVIVSVMVVALIRWKKIKNYRSSPQDEAETPQDNCLCNSIQAA